MKDAAIHSPIFYQGSKYQLVPQLKMHMPLQVNRVIEPFVGGGSFFLNVDAKEFLLNDLNPYLIRLHQTLEGYIGKEDEFRQKIDEIIKMYGLSSLSEHERKSGYIRLREVFNMSGSQNMLQLYVLMLYGFSHYIRFNGKGMYNVPFGNGSFNRNVSKAISDYYQVMPGKHVEWNNLDFREFISSIDFKEGDFVYLDPPYLVTEAIYNSCWNEQTEADLLTMLDALDRKGVKFAVSNVTHSGEYVNRLFLEWSHGYNSFPIESHYQSFRNNAGKLHKEVLVCNY